MYSLKYYSNHVLLLDIVFFKVCTSIFLIGNFYFVGHVLKNLSEVIPFLYRIFKKAIKHLLYTFGAGCGTTL